jgi:hypothetical protein
MLYAAEAVNWDPVRSGRRREAIPATSARMITQKTRSKYSQDRAF